ADSMNDEGLAPDGSNINTDYVTFDGQRWIQGRDGTGPAAPLIPKCGNERSGWSWPWVATVPVTGSPAPR
ncbi:hypothetical protein, partial [Streptomyces sp. NPDC006309]|uniref:hypothetical protein n=1 Tax=Streptomyces sp. NPDC006309 TaxID=3156749 RepID=UPI0033A0FFB4